VLGSTFPVIYNNGNQVLQFPGYVAIRYEMIHDAHHPARWSAAP
jgi:hypothetical protein